MGIVKELAHCGCGRHIKRLTYGVWICTSLTNSWGESGKINADVADMINLSFVTFFFQ
jgi:ribosomal protein L37AE/L43A